MCTYVHVLRGQRTVSDFFLFQSTSSWDRLSMNLKLSVFSRLMDQQALGTDPPLSPQPLLYRCITLPGYLHRCWVSKLRFSWFCSRYFTHLPSPKYVSFKLANKWMSKISKLWLRNKYSQLHQSQWLPSRRCGAPPPPREGTVPMCSIQSHMGKGKALGTGRDMRPAWGNLETVFPKIREWVKYWNSGKSDKAGQESTARRRQSWVKEVL